MSKNPSQGRPSLVGLIAGNGRLPLLLAQAARLQGIKVISAAVWGDTSFLIHLVSDEVRWFRPGDLEKAFVYFRSRKVKDLLMAGQICPDRLFDGSLDMDEELKAFFKAMADRRCDTIFGAIAERFKKEGMELLDSTLLIRDHLAPKGTLTRRAPTVEELEDIAFGIMIAKHSGAMDIGQTVVVKGKAALAVEALEGTDQCILRGGRIARQGAVIVKVSKPKQDDRFDVPVIGPRTIKTMQKCGAKCLAIEAGKTLIIDREKTVALANKAKITIVSA